MGRRIVFADGPWDGQFRVDVDDRIESFMIERCGRDDAGDYFVLYRYRRTTDVSEAGDPVFRMEPNLALSDTPVRKTWRC